MLFVLATTLFCSGCKLPAILPACWAKCAAAEPTADSAPATSAASIDVGGLVIHPGRQVVPAEGLTLRRALSVAGQAPQIGVTELAPPNITTAAANTYFQDRGESVVIAQKRFLNRQGVFPEFDSNEAQRRDLVLDPQIQAFDRTLLPGDQKTFFQKMGNAAASKSALTFLENFFATHPGAKEKIVIQNPNYEQQVLAKLKSDGAEFEKLLPELSQHQVSSVTNTVALPNLQLVGISRRQDGVTTTYYLPYDTAATDLGGEILLQSGDLVQVVNYRQTPFATESPVDANSLYRMQGFVNAPANFGLTQKTTIADALVADAPRSNDMSMVAIVERQLTGLRREAVVIPISLTTTQMSDFKMRPGDVCTVTQLSGVPLVMHGVVVSALRAGNGLAPSNQIINAPGSCAPAFRGRIREHCSRHAERCGIADTAPVRTATQAYETLRVRTQGISPAQPQATGP